MAQEVYRILGKKPESSTLSTIASTVGRGLARAAVEIPATAAALPRQTITAASQGLDYLLGALGAPKEITGRPEFQQGPEFLPSYPETKEAITKTVEPYLPEGALKPRNGGEQAFDELVGTTTALAIPFLGSAPSLLKSLGVASIGQGAKEIAKFFNFPEETANNVKLGVMIPASIFGTRGTIRKTSQQSYKKAEDALKNATLQPDKLKTSIEKIYDHVVESAMPGREETLKILKPVTKSLSVGKHIPVKKVWDLKKDMNAWLGNYKAPKQAIPFIEQTAGKLNEALREYGKSNPEFLQNYVIGDQIHGALANQSIISHFTRNNPKLNDIITNPLTKALLFGPKKIGAGIGALAPTQIYKIGRIMSKSPEARKIYTKAINDALKQDVKAYITDVGKLDKIIGKESNEGSYKILG